MTDPIPTAKVDDADRERIAAGLLMLVDPADALEAAIARISYLEERNDELQQDVARLTSDLGQARETISALTSSRARHLGERNDARAEVDRLAALLAAAEEGAEKQRNAACDLRDHLDKIAAVVGVGDGSAEEVTGRIVAEIEKLRARVAELEARPVVTAQALCDALVNARNRGKNLFVPAGVAEEVANQIAALGPVTMPPASPAQVDTPPAPTEPKPPRFKVVKADDVPPATVALWRFTRTSASRVADDLNAGRGLSWELRCPHARSGRICTHYAVIDTRPEEG